MISPILAFDFHDLNKQKPMSSNASVGHGRMTFQNALIEGGYTEMAPRFQYSMKGHGAMEAGQVTTLLQGKTGYTVSMWLMPYQSLHGTSEFRLLTIYGTNDHILLTLDYSSPQIKARINDGNAHELIEVAFPYTSDTLIPPFDSPNTNDGVWQFVGLTVNFSANDVKLYINGREVSSSSKPDIKFAYKTLLPQANIHLPDCIGGDALLQAPSFNGVIDQWQCYDRALSSEEISALFMSYGVAQTRSATEDQMLLNRLIETLGHSFLIKANEANLIHNGRVIKADRTCYERNISLWNDVLYLPEDLCKRYFLITGILPTSIDDGLYYPADEVAQANGYTYIPAGDTDGLFLLLAADAQYDPSLDSSALDRLKPFCRKNENEPSLPIEQSRRVVATSDTSMGYYTYSPSITRLGDTLYVSRDISCRYTEVFASRDDGETWHPCSRVEGLWWATIFEHKGALYLIGRYTEGGISGQGPHYVGVTRSADGGMSWSQINGDQGGIVYDGGRDVHCAPTPVLKHNGKLYRVFEWISTSPREFVMSADEDSDLTDPASWTYSEALSYHEIPNEGNAVIGLDGNVWILARLAPNVAYLMKLDETRNRVVPFKEPLDAARISFPSAVAKFTVRYDESTHQYLTIINPMIDPNYINQRNRAALAVSPDLQSWKIKEILLCDREIYNETLSVSQHAFQYVDWIIDGADILFVVRESAENAKNFHDSNYLTFYRIQNYRDMIRKENQHDDI